VLLQDLREKNWKAMDALNSMEKIAQKSTQMNADIENKDSVIRSLKDDLHKAKRSLYVRPSVCHHHIQFIQGVFFH
jgi:peptidoglycan hydrolase CwlO-like protein